MFGKGYIVDYCISLYLKEENERQKEDFFIKCAGYIAQGIEYISQNTAFIPHLPYFKGGEGKSLVKFADYMNNKPKDERTAGEVVDDVFKNCGF